MFSENQHPFNQVFRRLWSRWRIPTHTPYTAGYFHCFHQEALEAQAGNKQHTNQASSLESSADTTQTLHAVEDGWDASGHPPIGQQQSTPAPPPPKSTSHPISPQLLGGSVQRLSSFANTPPASIGSPAPRLSLADTEAEALRGWLSKESHSGNRLSLMVGAKSSAWTRLFFVAQGRKVDYYVDNTMNEWKVMMCAVSLLFGAHWSLRRWH